MTLVTYLLVNTLKMDSITIYITIRCLLSRITGIDLKDKSRLPIVQNTAITRLRWENGRFTVEAMNDYEHLAVLGQPAWNSAATLRHEPLDPRADRVFYTDCYRDAWLAAHGDLRGFSPEPYWQAACSHMRQEPGSVLRLLDGDTPVGLVDLDPRRAANEGCGWLSLLYLKPEYRGRGFGIQALGRAVVPFRQMGRQGLRLVVAEENEAARAFYAREGFRQIGLEEGFSGKLLLLQRSLWERRDDL